MADAQTVPTLDRFHAREIARLCVEQFQIAAEQRLELAGYHLAMVAKTLLENDIVDRPVVVLAGRGNKGRAGLIAARHLLNWGAWVQVVCTHPPDDFAGGAAQALSTLQMMGVPLAWAEEGWELPPSDLLIDAILGTGLHGTPHGKARDLIQLANSSAAPILSLDLPSGVDADTGETLVPHMRAAATLALGLPLRGLLASAARAASGELYLGDVGLPLALYEEMGLAVTPIFSRDPIVRWDVVEGEARLLV